MIKRHPPRILPVGFPNNQVHQFTPQDLVKKAIKTKAAIKRHNNVPIDKFENNELLILVVFNFICKNRNKFPT